MNTVIVVDFSCLLLQAEFVNRKLRFVGNAKTMLSVNDILKEFYVSASSVQLCSAKDMRRHSVMRK